MDHFIRRHRSAVRPPFAVPVAVLVTVLVVLPATPSIVLLLALTGAVTIAAYRLGNALLAVLSTAFLARLVVILLDASIGFLPTPSIVSGHNQRAIELATAWTTGEFLGVIEDVTLMRVVMAYLLAPFYVALGHASASGRIAVALAGVLAGYLVFRIGRRVVDRRTAVLAAAVVLFWPTLFYRSVVIQREVVLLVVVLAFLWAALQWLDRVTLPSIAVAIVATAIVFAFRKEHLLLVAVVVGTVSLLRARHRPRYLVGFVLFATPFLAYFALNFGDFTGFGSTLTPEAIDAFAYGRAHGDAAYLVGLHYDSWLDVALYAPLKVLYFLFTPFPWQIEGGIELVVGMSAIGLVLATALVRRGIGMLQHESEYLAVLLSYLVTGVLAYSIIEMNYGAAVRRRIQFVPIILLLAVIGLSNVDLEVRWSGR